MTTETPGKIVYCSTEQEYHQAIQAAGDKLVVVDCFAEWCPPCRQISPVFEALAQEYPHIVFIKVDVDKVPSIKHIVGVWAMPTFAFFQNGVKVGSFMGANERLLRRGLQNNGIVSVCSTCVLQ
mmetsp:Transcript_13440/g.19812  ORF Transcript_13440/g.19812 Transcript_13440/m.19812 type:complete len:124 (+) Transcript_13440:3-374(+)